MKIRLLSTLFCITTLTLTLSTAHAMQCKGLTDQDEPFEVTTITESNLESIPGLLDSKHSRFLISSSSQNTPYRLEIKTHSWSSKEGSGLITGHHFRIQYENEFGCFRNVTIKAKLSEQTSIDTTIALCSGGTALDLFCEQSSHLVQ